MAATAPKARVHDVVSRQTLTAHLLGMLSTWPDQVPLAKPCTNAATISEEEREYT